MGVGFTQRLKLAAADLLHLLARFHVTFGRTTSAEPLLRQAAELCRRAGPPGRESLFTLLNQVAVLQFGQGRYGEAEALYTRFVAEAEAAGEPGREDCVRGSINLGFLYQRLGRTADAERLYKRARQIANDLGQDHEFYPVALEHLGRLYLQQGRTDDAAELLRKVYRIRRKQLGGGGGSRALVRRFTTGLAGASHAEFAQTVIALAAIEGAKGNTEEAEKMLAEALADLAAVGRRRDVSYSQGLEELGMLRLLRGAYREAEAALREATGLDPHSLGDARPGFAGMLLHLAMAVAGGSRPTEAAALVARAAAIQDAGLGEVFALGTERHQFEYLGRQRTELDLTLTLLDSNARDGSSAFERVLKRKGLTVEVFAARREAVLAGRFPHLGAQLDRLARVRARHAELTLAGPGAEGEVAFRRELNRLATERDSLEAVLAREVPDASPTRAIQGATVARVAAQRDRHCPGAAVVEFVRYAPLVTHPCPGWGAARYLAFVLPPGAGAPRVIPLGSAAEIDRAAEDFRADVVAGRERNRPTRGGTRVDSHGRATPDAGPRLRRLVFDPLRAAAPGATRWLLAPDGALHTIPFEALPDDDGSRAIERYEFSYVGVGRELLGFGKARGTGTEPAVVAGPDFDLSGGGGGHDTPEDEKRSRFASVGHFARLPGATAEGREVANLLGVRPVTGPAAVKPAVTRLRSPRVLHLATHGFAVPAGSSTSNGGTRGDRLFACPPENPLLRSGLALAGANAWLAARAVPAEVGTGILTAEEVTGLDLTDTRLVVLSACVTGLGDVVGSEGVIGLRRAFVIAGAGALVVSLWPVPDAATRVLMAEFYRGLANGQRADAALRAAQLIVKADDPDPQAWAGFVFQGDPAPIRV